MKPHAFVAMPYGVKPGPDGRTPVDFDAVWKRLLQPALRRAGYEDFRADEEIRAGDIRVDMFQELLMADLVLVDLTVPNPNVWYELGVRHALRARGVVLVYGSLPGTEPPKAFDVYTDRKLRYTLGEDGSLLAARLPDAIDRLAEMIRETRRSSSRRIVSPVYQLLPHLEPPRWKSLLMERPNEASDRYSAWIRRVELARRRGLPGDILTLAGETPVRGLALEGRRAAGQSLLALRQFSLALEQYDLALEIDDLDPLARQKRVTCFGRMGRFEQAQVEAEALTQAHADDPDSWALLGRVAKDQWSERWRIAGGSGLDADPGYARSLAAQQDAWLEAALTPYLRAFALDPRHFYSGINALTLMTLRRHLDGPVTDAELAELAGGLRWALRSHLQTRPKDYWALASRAELATLTGEPPDQIRRLWVQAVACADRDSFAIDSSRQTLQLLRTLGCCPEPVAAGLAVLDDELRRAVPPVAPRQVLLFSGHMMDRPGRAEPRFPPAIEAPVAERLEQALAAWGAGPADLACCQAAAGGDLLFLEACQARGVPCLVLLPFEEPDFIRQSIVPSAQPPDRPGWLQRWNQVRSRLPTPPRILSDELGPDPNGMNPYERCNLWLLNTALSHGPDKLRFLAVWNGADGDGPGGTQHLKAEAERRTGQVAWIDTRPLLEAPPAR